MESTGGQPTQREFWPENFEAVTRSLAGKNAPPAEQFAAWGAWSLRYSAGRKPPTGPVYSPVALLPVARLEIHPSIAQLPMTSPPMVSAASRRGDSRLAWTAPVVVTRDFKIVDGRQRFWTALACRQDAVPCTFIKEEHITVAALLGILERSYLSRGQIAYLCALVMESLRLRRESGRCPRSHRKGYLKGSSEDFFHRGLERVLRTNFQIAEGLLAVLQDDESLRQKLEPAILRPQHPLSLHEALNIARRESKDGDGPGKWWSGAGA
ncbi:MAG: hypothetical protein KIT22_07125 [Verrucomicrobiae bacterium]|nr:hypothetical protein [Verrucomicrobiae bacterium]